MPQKGIDKVLSDTTGQKIDAVTGRNSANDVNTEDCARAQVRNVVSEAALECTVKDQTVNMVERATAKGDSGIQIGNR
jgi:Het-s 218-289